MHCAANRHRAILLLGPTGSGKTPLGELLVERGLWAMRCVHFDFGARLREIVARDRPDALIGRRDIDFLKEVLQSGALLESEHFPIARRILESHLAGHDPDRRTVVVLNGLPRHVEQSGPIDSLVEVLVVVHLACSEETVLRRIERNTGGDRTGRPDDDLASVRHKLRLFNERTTPLLAHYARQGARIETINVTPESTPEQMREMLDRRRPGFSTTGSW